MKKNLKKYTYIFGLIFIFAYFAIPMLLTMKSDLGMFSSETGAVGDTFGGILGPIVGFFGVLTTFWAFYIQYDANKEQKEQFNKQALDLKIERFENRFFELIRIHRENVEEISISGLDKVESRKAFISMFNELRVSFHVVYKIKREKYDNLQINDHDLVNIAFVLFYIGVGNNSNPLSLKLLSKYDQNMINEIISELTDMQTSTYLKSRKIYEIIIPSLSDKIPELIITLKYKPFCGHITRLGHYFRHLWLTVKYLDKQDEEVIKDKYEYIKIFRAQISNYEQLLLHYNAITDLGNVWIKEGLLEKYKLTKNIPVPMAYFGPSLNELYKDEKYFEWNEIL